MSSIVQRVIAALHRPARWGYRALRWALLALALLWLLVLSLWLLLHWAILPKLDSWRPELELQASKALGVSVQIGQLQVQTGGWMPVLDLREVRLIDPQGREALRLPKISAALSARSLLAWPPRLEQLYVHEPDLELRRDAAGAIWVAGLKLHAQEPGAPNAFGDWLLRQHEVAIQGGRLRWVDEQRPGSPALQLHDLQLLLRSSLRRHEIRVDATPPAELGQRFSLRGRVTQPLLARPADWRRWSGLFYADLPQASLPALRERLALPIELARGSGALRVWSELDRGQLRELTLDLAVRDLHLRLSPRVEPLELAQLDTRLAWQRQTDGARWSLRGLRFTLPGEAQPAWPASQASLSLRHRQPAAAQPWQPPAADELIGGLLQADRLDLALLARVAAGLPLGQALHQQLVQRQPQGVLRSLEARWQGDLDHPESWSLAGQAEGLALQPLPADEATAEQPSPLGQPGLNGASLRFAASERGGEAKLLLRDGAFFWPGLLDADTLTVREGALDLRWQPAPEGWRVNAKQLLLETPDIRVSGDAQWNANGRAGGQLHLRLRAPQAAVNAVPRYLPRSLPLAVRQYLGDALIDGQLRDLRLELKGPLADFPFRQSGQGLFRVSAQVQGGRYAYLPSHGADEGRAAYQSPWPLLEGLKGELLIDGPLLRLKGFSGRTAQLELSEVETRIDGLGQIPVLSLNGRWRGEAAQALAFVRQTPLNGWTHQALAPAQGSGAVSGQLQLTVPLQKPETTTVRGQVQLGAAGAQAGLQLRLRNDLPPFTQLRGGIEFSQGSLQFKALQARFLGGELRLQGGTKGEGGALFIDAEGQASAEGLRAAGREWPALLTLAPLLSGQTDYQLRLAFKGELPELELRSNLLGLASSLPEPLRKGAEQNWPLVLRVQPQDGGREAWGLSLGQNLRALLEREGGRTLRGAIRVGSEGLVVLPPEGVQLLWAAPQIDLDPWRALSARQPAASTGAEGSAWLPDLIQLQTPQLRLYGRQLPQVQASLQRAPNRRDWRIQLQSPQASGDIEWRTPAGQPPQLEARLKRLAIPKQEAEQVEQWLDDAQGALPMLDLQVEAFELRGKPLGKLQIMADGAAAGRDWTLQQLTLQHPDAQLKANGSWRAADHRTQLYWQLDIANSGRWMDALGFTNTVRGGKGQLKGVLGWRGSPLSPSSRGLDGQFSIALEEGQFLKADPGVARLLGILSLQSLPRRLLFDWRDVFSGGFAFDEFAGDVRITQGVASTKNLRMRGLQANVLMDGSADLSAETTELKVLVVPNLDAGGATLAYTAINPAIGLTTFLAQLLLRKPIEAANTTQLRISGPWADPKVEKVERSAAVASAPASPVTP
jgi:uncharacterized protein (TIGR02099 family)